MKNWKSVAGVVLVFLLGGLCGGLVSMKVCRHRSADMMHGGGRARGEFIVKRLTGELKLDDSQREEVRKIIAEAHDEMQALKKQAEPQREAIVSRSEDRVRAILRPEQKERFEKFVSERRERWKGRHE